MTLHLKTRFLITIIGTLIVSFGLFLWSTPAHHRILVAFWTADLPPLHGIMRIAVYLGLFLTAWYSRYARPPFGDSPLQAPELYDYTLPDFFSHEGAMAFVNRQLIQPNLVHLLRNVVLIAWACCIVGFGGSIAPVIVGLGTLCMHGIVQGCIGTSHRWYVPVYTVLALMFANGNTNYSVDAYLAKHIPHYWFVPPTVLTGPILTSGFARKLILVASIFTLVFGGITKFLNGGIQWLNGKSLAYYVSSDENGRSMLLKDTMHKFQSFSFLLAIFSVILECGAAVAIFSQFWRPIILLNAAGFHFGIWLTMWPNYFPQTLCYAFGTSWNETPGVDLVSLLHIPNVHTSTFALLSESGSFPTYFYSTPFMASTLATAVCIFLTFITLLRIEYWPLTGIPMYSFYRDHSYNYKFLRDAKQAQDVASEHVNSGYPNALAWSNLWIVLRLKNTDPVVLAEEEKRKNERFKATNSNPSSPKANLAVADIEKKVNNESSERLFVNLKNRATDLRFPKGVLSKQWRRALHNVAAKDMASKPPGQIEMDPEYESEGKVWLQEHRNHLRSYGWPLPDWADKTGELQLRCKLKEGYAILARVPWNPSLDVGAKKDR